MTARRVGPGPGGPDRPPAPAPELVLTGGRLALFADCLLVGVLTAVAALGVITAFPALVAACTVLRERVVSDRTAGLRVYVAALVAAVRAGPAGLLGPLLVAAVLGLDALALAAGAPGAGFLAALLAAAASAAMVLGLRAAAGWRPGLSWALVVRRVARAAVRDRGGSALLWLAGVASVLIAVTVPITVLLVGGPLAMAAVAVDGRSAHRR